MGWGGDSESLSSANNNNNNRPPPYPLRKPPLMDGHVTNTHALTKPGVQPPVALLAASSFKHRRVPSRCSNRIKSVGLYMYIYSVRYSVDLSDFVCFCFRPLSSLVAKTTTAGRMIAPHLRLENFPRLDIFYRLNLLPSRFERFCFWQQQQHVPSAFSYTIERLLITGQGLVGCVYQSLRVRKCRPGNIFSSFFFLVVFLLKILIIATGNPATTTEEKDAAYYDSVRHLLVNCRGNSLCVPPPPIFFTFDGLAGWGGGNHLLGERRKQKQHRWVAECAGMYIYIYTWRANRDNNNNKYILALGNSIYITAAVDIMRTRSLSFCDCFSFLLFYLASRRSPSKAKEIFPK